MLASNVDGVRDSVSAGNSGFLFQYNHVDDFVEKARRILGDPVTERRLQAGGRAWAEGFSWDRSARETEEFLSRHL